MFLYDYLVREERERMGRNFCYTLYVFFNSLGRASFFGAHASFFGGTCLVFRGTSLVFRRHVPRFSGHVPGLEEHASFFETVILK